MCENVLFCFDLRLKEYCAFNKQLTQTRYKEVNTIYDQVFDGYDLKITEWIKEEDMTDEEKKEHAKITRYAKSLVKMHRNMTEVSTTGGAPMPPSKFFIGNVSDKTKKSGGKTYYQDFKKNINDLKGFEEHGYIYEAPFVKVSGISSGTEIRNLLGSPKIDDKKREQIFKKTFGYFDKSTYEMMTSRFRKLFEFFQQPQVKKLMKEVSGFGSHFNASDMSDEGMYDFFGSLDDYYRISPEHAEVIGYELIDFPVRDSEDMMFTIMADEYEKDRTKTVTHGRTINQNRKNTESVDNPFPKYKERMRKTLSGLGFEIIKYFGEESFTKMKESPILKKSDGFEPVLFCKLKLCSSV